MNNIIPGEVGRVGWVESVSERARMGRERSMKERAARKALSHLCRPEKKKKVKVKMKWIVKSESEL